MEVTAFRIRLLISVLILLVAHVEEIDPQPSVADVRIVPSRLQLFVYESVSFTCEGSAGSAGWKVMNNKGVIKTNPNPNVTCNNCIDVAIESDSGEYWCEGEKGQRSNAVNITVTAGLVVLESPVLPVMKGEAVTLHCRIKKTSFNITADFYKDGIFIKTESTVYMTIQSVSKSNEGLYKCIISGAGESPESRLAVKDQLEIPKDQEDSVNQSKDPLVQPADKTESQKEMEFPHFYFILMWSFMALILTLQLLVIGLLYQKKQLVLLEAQMSDPHKDLYSVVNKKHEKERHCRCC
ncbi:low affinity immunoglobulin gamma Fc region receptor II-b-like [Scomber japonicus]|uniref:low affinity immunoglobulin gamma Fc region receptor II-b-like n=1 Tax=Scomber japonicus TaxID=13676 RepID=UPI002305B0A1|nr:low affinity immunoglobulin gamma Fc region receptor II-b-like [Scomber japonicus]